MPATVKPKASPVTDGVLVSSRVLPCCPRKRINFEARIFLYGNTYRLKALIDSGSDSNLLDTKFIKNCQIVTEAIDPLLKVNALNGELLALISEQTPKLPLLLAGNHRERISFQIMLSSQAPLVLTLPWLQVHNPVIDWVAGRVVSWSLFCHSSCLKSAQSPCPLTNCVAPPEPPDVSSVPPIYHGLAEVFSKHGVLSLPPHRPYDCTIDLLPGAAFPSSQL